MIDFSCFFHKYKNTFIQLYISKVKITHSLLYLNHVHPYNHYFLTFCLYLLNVVLHKYVTETYFNCTKSKSVRCVIPVSKGMQRKQLTNNKKL